MVLTAFAYLTLLGNPQDAVIGARRQAEAVDRPAQQVVGLGRQRRCQRLQAGLIPQIPVRQISHLDTARRSRCETMQAMSRRQGEMTQAMDPDALVPAAVPLVRHSSRPVGGS